MQEFFYNQKMSGNNHRQSRSGLGGRGGGGPRPTKIFIDPNVKQTCAKDAFLSKLKR